MLRHHHISLSRLFGGLVFSMFLVLTPRAWVNAESDPNVGQIPIESLEQPAECLWCDETPQDCEDKGDAVKSADQKQFWLNADEPVPPSFVPCAKPPASSPNS